MRATEITADAQQIARESAGNPLFTLELARAPRAADGALTASLERLIRDRLDELEDDWRQLVSWVAVLGHAMPELLLTEVAGLPTGQVARALERLERRDVLRVWRLICPRMSVLCCLRTEEE